MTKKCHFADEIVLTKGGVVAPCRTSIVVAFITSYIRPHLHFFPTFFPAARTTDL